MPIRPDWPDNAQYDPRMRSPLGMTGEAKIEKKRPMDETTDKLNAVVEELNHAISCLEQRLNPYLTPEPPQGTDKAPMVNGGNSPLSEQLGKVTNDLFLAINYIRRLTGRIE